MTVTLTHDPTNARVVINANQLGAATHALVQRSVDQVVWTTVRGGIAVGVTAGAFTLPLYDYEFRSDVLNHYRVTAAPPGLYLPGTAGNYASTPDNAALDITSDIRLRADVTLADWTPSAEGTFVAKFTTGTANRSYWLRLEASGLLSMFWSADGSVSQALGTTIPPVPGPGGRLAIECLFDVNNGLGDKVAFFSTAPTIDGPWTLLETRVSSGTTSIFSGSGILEVGSAAVGTGVLLNGVVHAVEVQNAVSGVVVANPRFIDQDHLDTSFVDAAGRTWTINGTAAILTGQTASITPTLTAIWLKSTMRSFLNRAWPVIWPSGADIARAGRGASLEVLGRSLPVGMHEVAGSRGLVLVVRTDTADDAQTLDYVIAAGDPVYLHTPAGCPLPSIHARIDSANVRRVRPGGSVRYTEMPLIEQAAPGPDVITASSTWEGLLLTYGTWAAVLAAYPTWADLLARVGDPSEVIVP